MGIRTNASAHRRTPRREGGQLVGERHVPHVAVKEYHHSDTHVRTAYELGDLTEVVVAIRRDY